MNSRWIIRTFKIAQREYMYNIKRRSFILSAVGVPIFTIGMMILSFLLADSGAGASSLENGFGLVDRAGIVQEALETGEIEMPEGWRAISNEESADEALRAEEIGAYGILTENYLNTGIIEIKTANSLTTKDREDIGDFLQAAVAQSAAPEIADRLIVPARIVANIAGTNRRYDQSQIFGLILSPLVFAILFMLATNLTSGFMMEGIVEEKENRIMEILVTSVTPDQLLWGKLLGLGALGMTQLVLWGLAGAVVIGLGRDSIPFIGSIYITWDMIFLILIYFVFAYMLFGALTLGIGATVTAQQEGRQISGLLSLLYVAPFMLFVTYIQNPNGTVPVILSLIPFTAPISVLMRIPLGIVPDWQIILSIVLLALTSVAVMWAAARIFRLGMLMYGKRLTVREIIRALRQGKTLPQTTAAGEGSTHE